MEEKTLAYLNWARARQGIAPYRSNPEMQALAREHALLYVETRESTGQYPPADKIGAATRVRGWFFEDGGGPDPNLWLYWSYEEMERGYSLRYEPFYRNPKGSDMGVGFAFYAERVCLAKPEEARPYSCGTVSGMNRELLKRLPWLIALVGSLALGLSSSARADTTEFPPLEPGYHYVTSIVVDNPITPTSIYAVYKEGTTTSTATDRGDIVPGAGPVSPEPGPDWRNSGTAPPWRRTACPGETRLARGTWFWNKYWQVRGDQWVLANAYWVFAADHPCRPKEPLPLVGPPSPPPSTSGMKTYTRGYPPPPPFSDLLLPARTVVHLPTEFLATGGQPDPSQGENVLAIEELPTVWDFGDGKAFQEYTYRPSHTYTWSSFGQPCPPECQAEIGQGLGAYRVAVTRRWRVLYRYEIWETDRSHDEPIYEEVIDPLTGQQSWVEIGWVTVADPDALVWSEVREEQVESSRIRWLPVIQVKGVNLGSG